MSDRLTEISLPHSCGVADWGLRTVPEMLEQVRSYARHQKAEAEKILSVKDEDFRVTTYVGVHVHRNRRVLQEGKKS